MALAALGAEYSEAELASVLGGYEFGTPSSRVTRLSRLGYRIEYGSTSLESLAERLRRGHQVISR
jgi:hypothetical protein